MPHFRNPSDHAQAAHRELESLPTQQRYQAMLWAIALEMTKHTVTTNDGEALGQNWLDLMNLTTCIAAILWQACTPDKTINTNLLLSTSLKLYQIASPAASNSGLLSLFNLLILGGGILNEYNASKAQKRISATHDETNRPNLPLQYSP